MDSSETFEASLSVEDPGVFNTARTLWAANADLFRRASAMSRLHFIYPQLPRLPNATCPRDREDDLRCVTTALTSTVNDSLPPKPLFPSYRFELFLLRTFLDGPSPIGKTVWDGYFPSPGLDNARPTLDSGRELHCLGST